MGCTLRFWSAGHPLSAVCRWAERAGSKGPETRDARRRRKPRRAKRRPPLGLHYGVICSNVRHWRSLEGQAILLEWETEIRLSHCCKKTFPQNRSYEKRAVEKNHQPISESDGRKGKSWYDMRMARKAQKERKTTARLKKNGARPRTTRTVKKSVTQKKAAATKKTVEKSEPAHRQLKKMSPKEWLETFFFSLLVAQLQEFFRWCWENIDKKQTRGTVAALYRETFFPFESMPEYKRLPIWRQTKVGRLVHGLTGTQAARLEKITRQWAEETGQNMDPMRDDQE